MGEMTDKIKGNFNEAVGKGKQAVSGDDADRNEKLDAEGKAQEAKGKAQQTAGKVKGALGDDI